MLSLTHKIIPSYPSNRYRVCLRVRVCIAVWAGALAEHNAAARSCPRSWVGPGDAASGTIASPTPHPCASSRLGVYPLPIDYRGESGNTTATLTSAKEPVMLPSRGGAR
jgi:hypothetical protein